MKCALIWNILCFFRLFKWFRGFLRGCMIRWNTTIEEHHLFGANDSLVTALTSLFVFPSLVVQAADNAHSTSFAEGT